MKTGPGAGNRARFQNVFDQGGHSVLTKSSVRARVQSLGACLVTVIADVVRRGEGRSEW